MTKSRGILTKRHFWTEDDISILRQDYPDMPTAKVAELLGVDVKRVHSKAKDLGIKKSEAYLASPAACRLRRGDNIGKAFRFEKGHSPWNKGVKGVVLGGIETQFKPGHRSGKALEIYKPIGTERISVDGYLERKVNDDMPLQRRWRAVHLILLESVNGPLPAGYALVFRDGNKQNITLENLELITRADLMRRNTCHRYGKEIALAIQLRGQITRQINKQIRSQS